MPKKNPKAMQIVVYDITGKNLSAEVLGEVSTAVEAAVKKFDTVAHTVVTE